MQHFKKSHDSMMVSEEDLNWAKSLVYNEWTTKWVANKAKPDYLSFFPPNTKKLKIDEKVAIFKFLGIDQTNNKHVLDICEQQGLKYQMATENYLTEKDKADDRILTRKGVYATAKAMEQLYQTLKK
jgi:hypothetical protein